MKAVKIGGSVCALAAAALVFYFFTASAETLPDDAESETTWKCRACGDVVRLTVRAYDSALRRVGGEAPLLCARCSQREVYLVAACDVCGTLFFGPDTPGETGRCPKCSPVPAGQVRADEDQPDPEGEAVAEEPAEQGGPEAPRAIVY